MTINPYVKQAGPYPVTFVKCPFYPVPVRMDAPRAGVLHTTEGGFVGSEAVFTKHWAPHFLLGLDRDGAVKIHQLVPLGYIGASLESHNDLALVQIEMVSYSKTDPWLPDAKTLDALAHLMVVLELDYGIPLSHPWPDDDWPRAGSNPHRASGKLGHVAGWYGHGDVPNNSHWDPGHLKWSEVFAYAQRIKTSHDLLAEAAVDLPIMPRARAAFNPDWYLPWQKANAKQIYSFFNGLKAPNGVVLQPHHAAGFVEQADAESSFVPNIWGDRREAYGWFQFHGDRLGAACKALGFTAPTFGNGALTGAQQLAVAWWDICSHGEEKALQALLTAKDAYEAGAVLVQFWERAGAPGQIAKRGQGAQAWLSYLQPQA